MTCLISAQVDDDPGDVPEEGDGNVRVDEGEEGLDHPQLDDIVAQRRSVADNVAQGPYRLKNIENIKLDDIVAQRRSVADNVAQGPHRLKNIENIKLDDIVAQRRSVANYVAQGPHRLKNKENIKRRARNFKQYRMYFPNPIL